MPPRQGQTSLLISAPKVYRTELTETQPGGYFSMEAGMVRFSPDSRQLVYLTSNQSYTASYPAITNYAISASNAGMTATAEVAIVPDGELTPFRVELAPNPVLVRRDGVPVPIVPTLFEVVGRR